jgi:NTE family protein
MKPEEVPSWEPFLKRIPLFSALSLEDLGRIISRLQPLSLPKGATLFKQGEESDALYLIVSGHARRYRLVDGRESLVAYLGRGDAVGETGLLTGASRSSTVRMDATTDLLKLQRKDFEDILREHPTILLHLSRTLALRLIDSNAGPAKPAPDEARLVVLDPAVGPERALVCARLGLELARQTRKKALLVDLAAEPGAVARALGLKPRVVGEAEVRAINLREPGAVLALAQEHPSGLAVLSVAPATLGGRLYGSLYLFLNALRDSRDMALVCLSGGSRGDVERSALMEADRVLMAGCDALRPQFRQMEAEVPALVGDPRRLLRVWVGELEPEDAPLLVGAERVMVPWSAEMDGVFEKTGKLEAAFAELPKAGRALERLARRLGGVRVGLALGTGAALGHATIGVLKVLKREGIPVDVIAGTSMGSLIAACYASGYEPEEIEDLALRIDKSWVLENLFWDMTVPRSGMFAGETLLRFIRSYIGSREFSDLEIPFACVAADIETGEEVVLRTGRVAEAVRASCGLPIIYEPIQLNGRWLVDGGLVNPVPTRLAADMGADVLLAVNLTVPAGDRKTRIRDERRGLMMDALPMTLDALKHAAAPILPKAFRAPNVLEVFFQMIYTMEYEVSQSRLEMAHVTMFPDLKGFSWTELHRAREIIQAGEKACEEALPRIKALVPSAS